MGLIMGQIMSSKAGALGCVAAQEAIDAAVGARSPSFVPRF
jgi:hypothetical protein